MNIKDWYLSAYSNYLKIKDKSKGVKPKRNRKQMNKLTYTNWGNQ